MSLLYPSDQVGIVIGGKPWRCGGIVLSGVFKIQDVAEGMVYEYSNVRGYLADVGFRVNMN
jgi:hypothetical protein